jgi:hypothetical protein
MWIAESVSRGSVDKTSEGAPRGKRRLQAMPLSVVALAVIVGVTASMAVWMLKPGTPATESAVVRLAVTLSPGEQATAGTPMTLSPNGRQLAYISKNQLYLRTMNSLGVKPIAGTEGA